MWQHKVDVTLGYRGDYMKRLFPVESSLEDFTVRIAEKVHQLRLGVVEPQEDEEDEDEEGEGGAASSATATDHEGHPVDNGFFRVAVLPWVCRGPRSRKLTELLAAHY